MTFRRWLAIFASILVAAAFLLAVGLFYAIRMVSDPGYPATTFDPAVQLQDNAFRWHDRSCDILVYGDSTANVGIDPRAITAATGLSACNIATNRPIVDTLGMLPVDAFLAHNPKPRILVLQFGPEDFYRARDPWETVGAYSPMVILTRDVPRATALRTMLLHPSQTTSFILYILQAHFLPHHYDTVAVMTSEYQRKIAYGESNSGQLDLGQPAETACDAEIRPLHGAVDTAWIAQLHRKYEALGMRVLIRASPLPACDPQLGKFQADLAPYVDGNVEALPVGAFVQGNRHTTHEGSQAETLGLVRLIQSHDPSLLRQE